MRDRLEEFHLRAANVSADDSESISSSSAEGVNGDSVAAAEPQAVVFEEEPIFENFMSEAQQIRDDITVLNTEVILLVATVSIFANKLKKPQTTYIHTCIHTFIHTYLHTYTRNTDRDSFHSS